MIEIEKPRIERVESGESYGKFVVEPLEHGFGQTLGNSLRRVLLSSLPGVAVSSIRIEGIQHEFSAVPGIKEDVAEIILNLGWDSQADTRRAPKRCPPPRASRPSGEAPHAQKPCGEMTSPPA